MSRLRPTLRSTAKPATVTGPSAYLVIRGAVQAHTGLAHGALKVHGAYCAIGAYFHLHGDHALQSVLIDEVAAVNDSVPHYTLTQRRSYMLRWLRWKCEQAGLRMFPGRPIAKDPRT